MLAATFGGDVTAVWPVTFAVSAQNEGSGSDVICWIELLDVLKFPTLVHDSWLAAMQNHPPGMLPFLDNYFFRSMSVSKQLVGYWQLSRPESSDVVQFKRYDGRHIAILAGYELVTQLRVLCSTNEIIVNVNSTELFSTVSRFTCRSGSAVVHICSGRRSFTQTCDTLRGPGAYVVWRLVREYQDL